MYKKAFQFLTENEIIYDLQFGFRQNVSTGFRQNVFMP